MLFDLPLEELRVYKPPREEPPDWDAFWQRTLAEARAQAQEPVLEPLDAGLPTLETLDVTFSGYGGQPIRAWLLLPGARDGRLPCVVSYIGYGGGRGFPTDWLLWASAGYAHLVMDTRGQGSTWQKGDTADVEPAPANPQHPGFLTRGILDPEQYYYRRLMTDAVRAVETARSLPVVDPERIAVTGRSQGGALALVASALAAGVAAAMPDVPFLCHYRRATTLVDADPYAELGRFMRVHRDKVDRVFHNLSYFDGVNFAARAACPALFSVGLMDQTSPPSTVFAAYNHYAGPKDIEVYEFNQHEGGGNYHVQRQLRFLRDLWS